MIIDKLKENSLITSKSNLFYVSKLDNEDAIILKTKNDVFYFTDSRYYEEFKKSEFSKVSKLVDIKDFINYLNKCCLTEINLEKTISLMQYENISKNTQISKFDFIDDDLDQMRKIKSEDEIQLMKKAQEATDKSFLEILNYIKEGITEIELAGMLESLLFKNGGSELAFKSIVAFQENASKPHCLRSNRKLKYGDLVLMDFGAKFGNYCSDMTRTVFFGTCTDDNRKIYNTVLECQLHCLEKTQLGVSLPYLNQEAINFYKERGVADKFIHSLGHGVGIDIHEKPFYKSDNEVLQIGNVITCEPGLYIEDVCGIRIEDMVYMSPNGLINLTNSSKEIIII